MKKSKKQKPKKIKKTTYISSDPVEAYKQGWKDGREDLIKRLREIWLTP